MKKIRALPVVSGGIEAGLLGRTERFLAACVETFPLRARGTYGLFPPGRVIPNSGVLSPQGWA